jgi:arabinogalactan oligomer / maltooligosaccharide transport system permease protein
MKRSVCAFPLARGPSCRCPWEYGLGSLVVMGLLLFARLVNADGGTNKADTAGHPSEVLREVNPRQNVGAERVVLWHSYRGKEEEALKQIVSTFHEKQKAIRLEALSVPYEALAAKLSTAIPRGNGPDLFIFAHERIGGWAEKEILAPLTDAQADRAKGLYWPNTLNALRYNQSLYGMPLSSKSVALFYNRDLVKEPPSNTSELITLSQSLQKEGLFPLAYPADKFYFHAPWFFGFGATLLDENGFVDFRSPGNVKSLQFVQNMQEAGFLPREPTTALVGQLFREKKAAMVISGPWFLGELPSELNFGVTMLPVVTETGKRAKPFLTVEAIFLSAYSEKKDAARRVMAEIAGDEGALTRCLVGQQLVANRIAFDDPRVKTNEILMTFLEQAKNAIPMDNRPQMQTVWEPGDLQLKKALRGEVTAAGAAKAASRRYKAITKEVPAEADPRVYLFFALALLLTGLALIVRYVNSIRRQRELANMARGWVWILPAMTVTALLIFFPFVVGLALAFFSHQNGSFIFVGWANFIDILSAKHYGPMEPLSFYFALGVTLLWTAVNLFLHVSVGLFLALLLNRPMLKFRGIYRVILILPWAVPNYITALIWKGLFHKQFGAINGILNSFGLEGISWFSTFWTAFFANICTNAWLGFPFMMVVCLGALQAIPKDLYEAAEVDGANMFQSFRHVTAPLLMPAMVPAILLGTVWTFNQFNIVYLVSGGEPDNSTDILISEAWRWAFSRQEQYGYAAAYAALIFVVLLGWSLLSQRIARRVEQV